MRANTRTHRELIGRNEFSHLLDAANLRNDDSNNNEPGVPPVGRPLALIVSKQQAD